MQLQKARSMSTRKKLFDEKYCMNGMMALKNIYIRMTANSLKERFNNHKKLFNDPKYESETELISKNVSKLIITNEKKFKIRW